MPSPSDPLWHHQEAAIAKCLPLRGSLLLMDMGSGKTRTVITMLERWQCNRALLFCPKKIMDRVWRAQIEQWSTRFRPLILDHRSVRRRIVAADVAWATDSDPLIMVMNYEAMNSADWFVWARTRMWDAIVCDEVHRIKSVSARASRKLHALGKSARRRVGMTGTPMHDKPMDLFGVYRFVDDRVFGTSFAGFRNRYAVMGGYMNKQIVSYQNEEELHHRMYSIAYRVETEDVIDLPERVPAEQVFRLTDRKPYDQMLDHYLTEVEGETVTADNTLVRMLRLREITGGHVKSEDGTSIDLHHDKEDALFDLLRDLAPDEPVVVFCEFRESMRRVAATCASSGRSYSHLSGEVDEMDEWLAGDTDVLIVQTRTGKEGSAMVRSRVAVYYDLPLSLGDFDQSWRRLLRPGQTLPVLICPLIAEDTYDEVIWQALKDKKEVVKYLTDDMRKRAQHV